MSKIFIISDTHFGQSATFDKFKRSDGTPLRPFKSLDEMHSVMIDNWNSVVTPGDLVLFLGDIAFSGQAFDAIMPQLNGTKRLIRGNHDRFSEGRYRRHFNKILGCYIRDRYCFTHVPIHPGSLERWKGNIHGHLHANRVQRDVLPYKPGQPETEDDPRYFNASCEQLDYTPIDFEAVKKDYFGDRNER